MKPINSISLNHQEINEEYQKPKRKSSCYYENFDEKDFDENENIYKNKNNITNEKNYSKNITLSKKEEIESKLEKLSLEKSPIDFEA
jgi:hypothetical protein